MRIVLIRHGETEWSASGRHTSYTDLSLTERGREAATRLRERLAGREFALVLCSPRARSQETAALAGLSPQIDPDLAEIDYGAYEGRTTKDIRAERPGWTVWRDGSPGGESLADAGARADRVLARARRRRTATSRCSPTGTSSASSARAGSRCRRRPERASRSTPRRSASSASSARRASSQSGTSGRPQRFHKNRVHARGMSRWMIAAVLAIAGAGLLAGGATAAKQKDKKPAGQFRQVLATKLGQELDKPAGDVLAALKAARPAVKGAQKGKKREAWNAAVAKSLRVEPQKVAAAVKALVKQRLDSLVADGWLTQAQADKRVDKLGVGFLRIR